VAALLSVSTRGIARADEPPIDQARDFLDRDDARAAINVLETALPNASAPDRPDLVQLLRRAYSMAADQADAAGKPEAARAFRDNLSILDRKPKARPKPASSPTPATKPAEPPTALRPPQVDPPDLPTPTPPRPAHEPGSISIGEATSGSTEKGPSTAVDEDSSKGKHGPLSDGTRPKPAVDDGRRAELEAADAAWVAKRYAEAGKIYASLATSGTLPAGARSRWAYCRLRALVARINANPRTAAEWESIRAELESIRALEPGHWFPEYLRNVIAQRSGQLPRPDPRRRVLRGSAPEDPPARAPARPSRPLHETPMDQPIENLKKIAWSIKRTENFTIWHTDPALADRVAKAAEAARDEQSRRWTGSEPKGPWTPRCNIVLFPDVRSFVDATGQARTSPGFSTIDLRNGRVGERFIKLRADAERLVEVVLPHEVTHVVLVDLFPNEPIPRWADEGMAILAEPADAQRRRSDLSAAFAANRLFTVEQILTAVDYPADSRHWPLYHAQSVSLTRFLVHRDTPRRFVEFLRASQADGLEPALRRIYQIDGFADLQRLWLADCRRPPAEVAARPEDKAGSHRD
jgi:hypothetical protein